MGGGLDPSPIGKGERGEERGEGKKRKVNLMCYMNAILAFNVLTPFNHFNGISHNMS